MSVLLPFTYLLARLVGSLFWRLPMDEEWRPVLGYEDYYEVSNLGRVRSVPRKDRRGSKWQGKLRAGVPQGKYGHVGVMLYRHSRGEKKYVYRLVLEAFVGPCPPGCEACHSDGDTANNALCNLRWDTHQANMNDAVNHGTVCRGEAHSNCRYTDDDCRRALDLRRQGLSYSKIQRATGMSMGYIHSLVHGKRRPHLTAGVA